MWEYKTSEVGGGVFILGQFEDNTISVSARKLNKCMSVNYTAACSWSSGALRKDSEEAFILNGLRRPKFPHNEMHFIRKQAPPTTPQRLSSQVG